MYFGVALASAVVHSGDVISTTALHVSRLSMEATRCVLSDVIASFCSFPLVTSRVRNSLELVGSLLGDKLGIVEKLLEVKRSTSLSGRSSIKCVIILSKLCPHSSSNLISMGFF